jgi:hypothetical protein
MRSAAEQRNEKQGRLIEIETLRPAGMILRLSETFCIFITPGSPGPDQELSFSERHAEVAQELTLLFHLIGFGLLATTSVAGIFLHLQYRKAPDLQAKAALLQAMRPIGLLSPVAVLIMLVTGIGNMHAIGAGLLTLGWLTAKIIFFAMAVISGALFSVKSKQRGALIQKLISGNAPPYSEERLEVLDRQILLFYIVMPLLLVIILYLSVIGRLGAQ